MHDARFVGRHQAFEHLPRQRLQPFPRDTTV